MKCHSSTLGLPILSHYKVDSCLIRTFIVLIKLGGNAWNVVRTSIKMGLFYESRRLRKMRKYLKLNAVFKGIGAWKYASLLHNWLGLDAISNEACNLIEWVTLWLLPVFCTLYSLTSFHNLKLENTDVRHMREWVTVT